MLNSGVETACDSLNSVYKLNKYIEVNMGLVKPVEYVLGYDRNGKPCSLEYVPILESIKNC